MKIAAVHMDTILCDVKANMENARRRIEAAVKNGAELVLFPEFFTTGFAFTPKLLESILKCEDPQINLNKWAKEFNVIIGGSYIKFYGEEAFNTFSLTFPNGQVFTHSKDIPTALEQFCYTYGDENNVLETPIGKIGVAMCWEQIRYNTVRRMVGKVDLILTGSCWWGSSKEDPIEFQKFSKESHNIAVNAPITLAKLLHVPVIHSSHTATFKGVTFPKGDKPESRTIMGATQIIDESGNVIHRRMYNEVPGIISCDIKYNTSPKKVENIDKDKYWIPEIPPYIIKCFDYINAKGEEYYNKISKPYYMEHVNK